MKKILFLLLVWLIPVMGFSFTELVIDECKTDVYFGNGILTEDWQAEDNAELLELALIEKFGIDYYNKHIGKVDYAYNSTDGGIIDVLESLLQKIDGTNIDKINKYAEVATLLAGLMTQKAHDADLKLQVEKYKDSIKEGHKVLSSFPL